MTRDPLTRGARFWQVFCMAGGLVMLLPLVWMALTSLKSYEEILLPGGSWWPAQFRWENYPQALHAFPFARCFANSLLLSVIAVSGTLVSTILGAYAFALLGGRWQRVLFALMLGAILVPSQVTAIPLFRIFATWGWIDTWWPLAIPAWLGTDLFALFLLRQAFRSVPRERIDAARADGAGDWALLWHVMLPSARPAVWAVTALSFVASWNDLWGPLIFLNSEHLQTLPAGLVSSFASSARPEGLPWHHYMAATTLMIIPVLCVFLFAQSRGALDSVWRSDRGNG